MKKFTLLFIISVMSVGPLMAQQRKHPARATFPMAKIDSMLAVGQYDEAIEKLNTENLEFPLKRDSLLRIAQKGSDMMQSVKSVKLISRKVLPKNAIFSSIPQHKEECLLIGQTTSPLISDYQNGYGDKKIISGSAQNRLSPTQLYETYKVGGLWSEPETLEGLGDMFEEIRNPFLLSDGQTLYFAAKEPQSVSGFDLYVTRYDLDMHTYYKPENLGFPFSSLSDDYLFWIDELENRIYLVTDRGSQSDSLSVFVIENQEDFDFLPYSVQGAERRMAALLYEPVFKMPEVVAVQAPVTSPKPTATKQTVRKKPAQTSRKKK